MATPSASLAPRQTIDGQMISHFVELPFRRQRGRSWSVCGELVDERDMSDRPTCPTCIEYLEPAKTADELFGAESDQ